MVDFGIARAKYLDVFVENIKWSEASGYRAAPHAALPVVLLLEPEPPKRFGA